MLDVGPDTAADQSDGADLIVFVDRLAAAGSDRCTASAQSQIRRAISAGTAPPGLRRLAEALAASVGENAPAPRRPVDDPATVVSEMPGNALMILEDFGPDGIVQAIAALVADGRRVIVTAPTPAELATVRDGMPDDVRDRILDRLPGLAPSELRELRRLLAASTPASRARRDQQLPPPGALPPVEDVAELCARANRSGARTGSGLIPELLAGLDDERRGAVISVAQRVLTSLHALEPRTGREWAWSLLADLIYNQHRAVLERMLGDTAQAAAAVERARNSPPVTFTDTLPMQAADMLRRYLQFLASGGRSRSYFRPAAQRDVQPLLDVIRVGGRVPSTAGEIAVALEHIELGERLIRIDAGCVEMGIPAPRDAREFTELTEGLVQVAAAARSVGALRHDVLFLHPDSPVSVPDVSTAEQIATAIMEYAEHGSVAEASRALDRAAAALAMRATVPATAPEHERAVAALRARDPEAYAVEVEALSAARREMRDEVRREALLDRMRASTPALAAAWDALGEQGSAGLGMATLVTAERLLSALPPADSADVVVVLGAANLGVERLLLAAVAPRMIAVVEPGPRQTDEPTLVSVLRRATTLVIRGRANPPTSGRVVPLTTGGSRSVGVPTQAVGQAGA